MSRLTFLLSLVASLGLAIILDPLARCAAQSPAAAPITRFTSADYDSEPRKADGRVDIARLTARLKELGVGTYYWLVWHAATDWDDLKLFLPAAATEGIQVWVYLVPPTESPPSYGTQYSEPFRLDYQRWAREIAQLSLTHTNLTGWVIDDFYANHPLYTPEYVKRMRDEARRINPRLPFLPLMYFNEVTPDFVERYREAIDGVVVAYPQDRLQIDQAWEALNDRGLAGQLAFPGSTPSAPGDFVEISQPAAVDGPPPRRLRFRQRDDFTGPTAGYHFKQMLIDERVAWEQDVAGGKPALENVEVEVTELTRGQTNVTLAFRIFDKRGVSNFGVRWDLTDLAGQGIQPAADFTRPDTWRVQLQGPFQAGFGPGASLPRRRYHIPFIVMTAGSASEFVLRHGEPGSPERMAEWLRMCLEAQRDGKCDAVVTYCLDKQPGSRVFDLARDLFAKFAPR